jgi:hypothetical protein
MNDNWCDPLACPSRGVHILLASVQYNPNVSGLYSSHLAVNGHTSENDTNKLVVSADVRAERLARQVSSLQRQILRRAAEMERLGDQLAHSEAERQRLAHELDALQQTRTMRLLQRPRAFYAKVRALRPTQRA